MTALPILSNSRLKAARSCLRYDRLRYVDGYRPTYETEDTRFGSLIHLGLERWWLAYAGDAVDPCVAAIDIVRQKAQDDFELVKAEELLAGYDARWRGDKYEVIAVEQEFTGPLINPGTLSESRVWQRGGKIDVIVRAPDGRIFFIEHKTSSEDISQGSEYWRRLRIDGQVSTYYEGCRILGHEVAGCIYDVIGKPGIRPATTPLLDDEGQKIVLDAQGVRVRTKDGKKWRQTSDAELGYVLQSRPETPEEFRRRLIESIAENPARYYQREQVVRLESELYEALLDDWHFGQTLREAIRMGRAPRNADACIRYGKTCEFFDACTGVASLDDPTRFTRSANVHPELTLHQSKEETVCPPPQQQ